MVTRARMCGVDLSQLTHTRHTRHSRECARLSCQHREGRSALSPVAVFAGRY